MSRASDVAFDEFAEAAIPGLRRLARSACRDLHRADDLVQDHAREDVRSVAKGALQITAFEELAQPTDG